MVNITYCCRCHDIKYNDIQHNDTQHNNTQYNGLLGSLSISSTQHNYTQYNSLSFIVVSVAFFCCYSECHYVECHHAPCHGVLYACEFVTLSNLHPTRCQQILDQDEKRLYYQPTRLLSINYGCKKFYSRDQKSF